MNHTGAILDFAATPHSLPAQVHADALRLLGDTLAVGAAGLSASHLFKPGLNGCSRPIDGTTRLPADAAAFANGFAIHSLEWDAVHEPAVVHALSVVTAALLAASDQIGGSDPDHFLTCLAVGVDVASGIGLAATGPMRFFRPATAGILGAALAVARLNGIAPKYYADVLGFAYSFASGTMQAHVEASIALPFQIGNAARSAITAVDLVAHSHLPAPHDVLEGPFGYAALIEPLDLGRYTADLGKVWRISEVSVKPFPSGRASHGALGALQELALKPEDVESIELFAPPLIHRLVGRPFKPDAEPSYNRLCLAFLAPLMLRDGHIDPRLNATIPDLAEKVSVTLDGNPDGNALSPQRLIVRLKDGRVIERQIDANLGSPQAPLSATQAAAKYDLCRMLAGDCDPRIFTEPLTYATDPR